METTAHQPVDRSLDRLRRTEHFCLAIVMALAMVMLVAWWAPSIGVLLPVGWDVMKANTAFGMLLAAAGLWLLEPSASAVRLRTSWALAALLMLLASFTLLEYISGDRFGIDTLLAADAAAKPGLMSAQTAFGFLLLSLLMPMIRAREGPACVIADLITLALAAFVLVLVAGYIFGAAHLLGESLETRVSRQTAFCFGLLAFVVGSRRVESGFLSVLRGPGIGSRIARISVPVVILLMFGLSIVRNYVTQAGLVAGIYASAVTVSFICFAVSCLILLMAWHINRLEERVRGFVLQRAEAQVRVSEQRYVDLVEQALVGIIVRSPTGEILLVNPALCRLTGYTREELLRMNVANLADEADPGVLPRLATLEPDETLLMETRVRRKDGTHLPIEVVIHRLRDGNLQSMVQDLSKRKQAEHAHAVSERRYAELVDQALEGITVRKSSGEFLFANDTFCRMLGYSRVELLGMSIRDVVHPEDAETIEQVQRLGSGDSLRMEKRMRRKDGGFAHVEVSARRLQDGSIQSTIQDVSERKRAEGRFRAVVEGAPNAMIMADEHGGIALVNSQTEKLFGYKREELIGQPVEKLVPVRYRDEHPSLRAHFHRDPKTRSMGAGRDLYALRKDGSEVPVEIGLNPLVIGDGHFVLASVIDITERKRSEQLVHAAEERYRAAIGALAEGIAILDAEGRVVAHNDSGTRILGLTADEFTGRMVMDPSWSLENEDGTPFDMSRHPVMITLATGQDVDNVILGLARPDGSHRLLTVNSRGLALDAEGKPTSVLASFRDITEQRHSERALRDYAEELRLLSQRLLEAQETERRAIARELHDEVGQALTAARINLKELERQVGDGPLAKQAADASAIVAQLLQQVRQLSLDMHPTVLDDLGLAASLRWLVRTRAGNELNVTLDLAEDLPRFTSIIEHTLFRVFQEALSNALRHSGARNLSVELGLKEGQLHLAVRDDGHGFDAEAARKHALSGASLGVIGMQERARLAGGQVVIESTPGKGTQIRVFLPTTELQE